jgi:hypothetical protein
MTRRFFGVSLLALLSGCSGAGVTTVDLRGKVAAEVARVVVTLQQIRPWADAASVSFAQMNEAVTSVQSRVAARHAEAFSVEELNDLRRFYSGRDGETVVALAYAAEGGREKPPLDAAQFDRVDAAFADPVIARSVSVLRDVLREAFQAEFAF